MPCPDRHLLLLPTLCVLAFVQGWFSDPGGFSVQMQSGVTSEDFSSNDAATRLEVEGVFGEPAIPWIFIGVIAGLSLLCLCCTCLWFRVPWGNATRNCVKCTSWRRKRKLKRMPTAVYARATGLDFGTHSIKVHLPEDCQSASQLLTPPLWLMVIDRWRGATLGRAALVLGRGRHWSTPSRLHGRCKCLASPPRPQIAVNSQYSSCSGVKSHRSAWPWSLLTVVMEAARGRRKLLHASIGTLQWALLLRSA